MLYSVFLIKQGNNEDKTYKREDEKVRSVIKCIIIHVIIKTDVIMPDMHYTVVALGSMEMSISLVMKLYHSIWKPVTENNSEITKY